MLNTKSTGTIELTTRHPKATQTLTGTNPDRRTLAPLSLKKSMSFVSPTAIYVLDENPPRLHSKSFIFWSREWGRVRRKLKGRHRGHRRSCGGGRWGRRV
eukprot:TRINITY_DN6639_c1_g3_i1.p1 TRINITY_DN6639_c1_g3~~TRINITY_DN6639_c1_g3_i1.p1  ORF type:complete len:100 (+),score=13.89 TRINITY_DN6639_c1_g3_i1:130-429(+)